MALRRTTKGILVYNLLLKEISEINRHLPEDRKLSIKERRELVSKKIYPKYRGKAKSSIRLTPLRDQLYRQIRKLPRKEGCDLLAIPPNVYQDIPYYEVESFIENILPNCIYIKVNAGEFGETSIFNTREFNYYTTGISDITNRINEYCRKHNIGTSRDVPVYNGYIMLRPGKKNDGIPDNYYLEMILQGVGRKQKVEEVEVPLRQKTKRQTSKEANVKQYVLERLKNLKNEKSAFKRIKRSIYNEIKLVKELMKQKFISKNEKNKIKERSYKNQKARIEKYFRQEKISPAKYRTFIRDINKAYGKGKNKDNKA